MYVFHHPINFEAILTLTHVFGIFLLEQKRTKEICLATNENTQDASHPAIETAQRGRDTLLVVGFQYILHLSLSLSLSPPPSPSLFIFSKYYVSINM